MPDPSSFFVGNAPGGVSYAAPLLNFSALEQLPQSYMQGTQNARTLALQNAFKNGLPRNPDGSLDINTMTDTLARLGGADAASNLIPLAVNQQIAKNAGNMLMPNGGAGDTAQTPAGNVPLNRGPASSSAAAGPANITGGTSAAAGNGGGSMMPGGGEITGGNTSGPTALSLAQQAYGQGQKATTAAANLAKLYGVAPDAPLDRDTAGKMASTLGRFARTSPQPSSSVSSANEDPSASGATTQDTNATEVAQNGPNAAPPAGSGASGSPAPTGAAGTNATQSALAQSGLVPSGVTPQNAPAYVKQNYLDPAQRMRAVGTYLATATKNPEAAKGYEAQAASLEAQGNRILDLIKSSSEQTGEQKNALASGAANPLDYTTRQKEMEQEVAQSQKTYNGIHGAAAQYQRDLEPYLNVSRSLLNDPSLYTGAAGHFTLDINRIRAAASQGDQKAAMLQEALQKVTAGSVLAQLNVQKDQMAEVGSNAGRVFKQTADLVEKAAPQLATTLGGNRFLIEVQSRMGELAKTIDGMAQTYMSNPAHRHLTPEFDRQVANYMQHNPLFTKQEMSHPELLGAPTIPPDMTNPADIYRWGSSLGYKPGDPIRTSDGRIKALPRIQVTPGASIQ